MIIAQFRFLYIKNTNLMSFLRSNSILLKHVFLYGTLKRGEPNHYWLTSIENGYSKFLAKGITVEKFPLVIGTRYNIPFLLYRHGMGYNIDGEIYEVDEKMLINLDILEDYPNFYDREIENINISIDNETIPCWIYVIKEFPDSLLAKEHLRSYHNKSNQPYGERTNRNVNVNVRDDMNY